MTTVEALFDTNIVIYLALREEKYLQFFQERFRGRVVGVSVVTFMEALMGVESEEEARDLSAVLAEFESIALDENIASRSVRTLHARAQRNLRSPHLADTIIAHTALALGVPLVTNNPGDFAAFEGLKTLVP